MLSYSEIFNKKFGGGQYGCLKSGQIVVKRAKTVNLTYLLNILRSKDQSVMDSQEWMFDGEIRFLQGDPIKQNKIAFVSYPRTGNSFIRKLIENVTGTVTSTTITLHMAT